MDLNPERLEKFRDLHRETAEINLNPIQRGGILPEESRRTAAEWMDGYSICDFCGGDLHCIKKPPVDEFVNEILPGFLGCDRVGVTHGARESKFIIMHSLCEPGDAILVDGNAHYSTYVAAERAGLTVHKVANSGGPEYRVDMEAYAEEIERVKPKLALLTYPDGKYGNLPDAAKLGKICSDHDVPLALNCAYSIGRMPVDNRKLKADFLVASGHKSMAASGPIGLLATSEKYADIIYRRSEKYPNKIVELLGCSSRGLPMITLMASFPHVAKRVGEWQAEVERARRVSSALEGIDGIEPLGTRPKEHDLIALATPLFDRIAKKHKKRGFFLYRELKKRGITGIKPGATKNIKLSTYMLNKDETDKLIEAFTEISRLDDQ